MKTERPALKQQINKLSAGAWQFLEDIEQRYKHFERRAGFRADLTEFDPTLADELHHQLRLLTPGLALAIETSPVLTRGDVRDLGLVSKRMCAALRFEKYTHGSVERRKPIETWNEVQKILRSDFDAIAAWIDLVPDREETTCIMTCWYGTRSGLVGGTYREDVKASGYVRGVMCAI